jgi:hypothetical protein
MAEEKTGWDGDLWKAADLVTPMAIRAAATLRLADRIAACSATSAAGSGPSAGWASWPGRPV